MKKLLVIALAVTAFAAAPAFAGDDETELFCSGQGRSADTVFMEYEEKDGEREMEIEYEIAATERMISTFERRGELRRSVRIFPGDVVGAIFLELEEDDMGNLVFSGKIELADEEGTWPGDVEVKTSSLIKAGTAQCNPVEDD